MLLKRDVVKVGSLLVILGIVGSLLINFRHASAATFTVSNTNDSGGGSLRDAITQANATAGADTINFSIGSGHVQIIPTTALPAITRPVTIDATSQPGFSGSPLIELSGNGAGSGARGLYITGNASGTTVKGMVINRFSAQGIFIDTTSVTVTGNYIGTDSFGSSAAANGGDGIAIFSGTSAAAASSNTIGGTTSADRNVISGNSGNGIGITAQVGGNASNNVISGNYIGTNAAGTGAIANQGDGILINHADGGGPATASGNRIGGTTGTTPDGACTGACNVISGNGANGIGLWHGGVSGSLVQGNYVGTNAAGTGVIRNGDIGIELNESPNNTVGTASPAGRNIFSGNAGAGVFLTGAAATGNTVQGNYIGTNAAGTSGLGNLKMGVGIGASPGAVGANSDVIGGTSGTTPGTACAGACNLISGNGQNGIFITGSESTGHSIVGNYIGLNVSGSVAIGNASDGIGVLSTPNLSIGNGANNGRNIIGSNGSNGIIIAGAASTGNRIDTNTVGFQGFGNTASGIAVSGATDTAILGNAIYFNGYLGIDLDNNGTPNLNDTNDGDGGANRLQNFPDLYAARNIGSNTKIGGQFNGAPNSSFRLDFFYSSGCNGGPPRNYGQGNSYIGSTDISTDIFGNTAFGYTSGSAIPGNTYVTATATKKIGNTPAETSEFSKCVLVNAAKPAVTNGATWLLKDYLISGGADKTFGYGFPAFLLLCAWDPAQPGVKLPVVYSDGNWFMRASYTTGTADLSFSYGSPGTQPVCGDWNGDGIDSVGIVTPTSSWFLRNINSSGPPDAGQFQYGPYNAKPVVGDWDGNGTDTVGLVDSGANWYLRNSNNSGSPDAGQFSYGYIPGTFAVGDWDGNGTDTVGTISGTTWAIRNSNSSGAPNGTFQFGIAGGTPLTW